MQVVVIGAGAIGGLVGGLLARAGHDVAFVARGAHGRRIAEHGLKIRQPVDRFTVQVPTAADPADLPEIERRVALLAVKSQDTPGALDALARVNPRIPVVCLQNGTGNEAAAADRFSAVYGVPVMCPALHLEPGVVEGYAHPVPAILDVGRYPSGVDATAEELAAAFRSAGIESQARPDIMRWKWGKLLMNLHNSVEVVCRPQGRSRLSRMAVAEGAAVLDAAGIDHTPAAEEAERRGDLLQWDPRSRPGGSTWQSVTRGTPVETDHLTGQIVRLGRRHGVPTPINETLLLHVTDLVDQRGTPGQMDATALIAEAHGS